MRVPQMTTRRWMAVILILVTYSLAVRSAVFLMLASYHEAQLPARVDTSAYSWVYYDRSGNVMTAAQVKASRQHQDLWKRYRTAAVWPWMPVDPDVPDPD
jgi:hypothetical protein